MKHFYLITIVFTLLIPLIISGQVQQASWQARILEIGNTQQGGSFEMTVEISETVSKKVWTETIFVSGDYSTKAEVVQILTKLKEKYERVVSLREQFTVGEVIKL